uniref:Uncharacterized protein n=1 Tax=Arundo donax TaxID=35708 RepID=A0A0A9GU39_ARUDO
MTEHDILGISSMIHTNLRESTTKFKGEIFSNRDS